MELFPSLTDVYWIMSHRLLTCACLFFEINVLKGVKFKVGWEPPGMSWQVLQLHLMACPKSEQPHLRHQYLGF